MISTICRSIRIQLFLIAVCAVIPKVSWAQVIDVDVTPSHVKKSFVPNQTLGAGIDRIPKAVIDANFNKATSIEFSKPDGDRLAIVKTRNSTPRPGTGIQKEHGAIRAERAISLATRIQRR